MASSTPSAFLRGHIRRAGSALRSLRPSSVVAVTLVLLFGTTTIADAANGGNFLLGKSNSETTTATLTNTTGTPLSLHAKSFNPPLAVNSRVMVNNLNAQFTDGFSGPQLAAGGGGGFTAPGTDTDIGTSTVVASAGPLPPATYLVTATAFLDVAQAGFCSIVKASDPGTAINEGGSGSAGQFDAAETAAVTLTATDTLEEVCHAVGRGVAFDAGITAVRIFEVFSTKHAARTGTPATAPRSSLPPPAPTHQPAR
jgi:hypothetical protein